MSSPPSTEKKKGKERPGRLPLFLDSGPKLEVFTLHFQGSVALPNGIETLQYHVKLKKEPSLPLEGRSPAERKKALLGQKGAGKKEGTPLPSKGSFYGQSRKSERKRETINPIL